MAETFLNYIDGKGVPAASRETFSTPAQPDPTRSSASSSAAAAEDVHAAGGAAPSRTVPARYGVPGWAHSRRVPLFSDATGSIRIITSKSWPQ